jgi:hypothetical protein
MAATKAKSPEPDAPPEPETPDVPQDPDEARAAFERGEIRWNDLCEVVNR